MQLDSVCVLWMVCVYRLQVTELTLSGETVRHIGAGIIEGDIRGIAVNNTMVAVGKYDPGVQVSRQSVSSPHHDPR